MSKRITDKMVSVSVGALLDSRRDHIYLGGCPDSFQPKSRDEECRACRGLLSIDAAIRASRKSKEKEG